jgi:hypothetical protein
MKQLVEFKLSDDDQSTIFVEVEEPPAAGRVKVARPGERVISESQQTFEKALENLNPMFSAIKKKFDQMNEPADEVEVKFGLKLNATVGAVISAGGEASYEITLRWNNHDKK